MGCVWQVQNPRAVDVLCGHNLWVPRALVHQNHGAGAGAWKQARLDCDCDGIIELQ
jgi:hypothetical protein